MTWSEEVHRNRIQVLKASGGRPTLHAASRHLQPSPQRPQPNSGLAPICLVASLLAGAVFYQKEGHKLRGRRLPSWLEPLQPLLRKLRGSGRPTGLRPSSGGGTAAPPRRASVPPPAQQQQPTRHVLAAAAEQRLRQVMLMYGCVKGGLHMRLHAFEWRATHAVLLLVS